MPLINSETDAESGRSACPFSDDHILLNTLAHNWGLSDRYVKTLDPSTSQGKIDQYAVIMAQMEEAYAWTSSELHSQGC